MLCHCVPHNFTSHADCHLLVLGSRGGQPDECLGALLTPGPEPPAAVVSVLVEEAHAREGLLAVEARVLLGLEVLRLQVRTQVRLVGEGA